MDERLEQLSEKKKRLDNFKPLPSELIKNLDEWFRVEFTYASNAIEGNTLSRQETALVLEKGTTVEGKTLREHLEVTNHAKAIDFIRELLAEKYHKRKIGATDILDIHRIILRGIDDTNAGRYRTVAVRIAGANVILPNPVKIPELMEDFIQWLHRMTNHPVKIAADAHFKLVSIHPFVDGNGRTARLLMNLLLMQEGYPPGVIRPVDRLVYIKAIEKGQTEGDLADYYTMIYDAVDRSLDLYLDAVDKSL